MYSPRASKPLLPPENKAAIERVLRGALHDYKDDAGGDVFAFSIPATTYLVHWLGYMRPDATKDFLEALAGVSCGVRTPDAEARFHKAEQALAAALQQ